MRIDEFEPRKRWTHNPCVECKKPFGKYVVEIDTDEVYGSYDLCLECAKKYYQEILKEIEEKIAETNSHQSAQAEKEQT